MHITIYNFKEITASREILEREPHRFINLFLYFLLIMVVVFFIWTGFSKMDVSVKSQAVIRPNSKISIITNAVSSRVNYVDFEQGEKVSAGDILYAVEYEDLIKEKDIATKQLENTEFDLTVLQALKDAINNDTEIPAEIHNSNLNSRKQLENDIVQAKKALVSMTLFKNSIIENKNLLSSYDDEYYTKYLDYKYNYELLKLDMDEKEDDYNVALLLYENGAISLSELNDSKKEYSTSRLQLEKYKNESLKDAYTIIKDSEETLKESSASIETEIISSEKSLETQKHDLIVIENSVDNAIVKAPIDGTINVLAEVNAGDYLLENTQVLTIVPNGDSEFRCKLFVSNKDISKIEVGDKIKYKFKALPYKEYGLIKGKVLKISSDISTLNQANGQYVIEASIENKPLFNYKGERAQFKAGMEGEALIVTDSKTVLRFLLEKIDLIKN